MTAQEFIDKYNGVGVDYDGYYGNQCMDEFLQYNQDVVNAPRVFGNAKDVWNTYPTAFYDQIPNSPDNFPQLGDVIIWGTGIGAYGHIAIVESADANSFTSLDQNWNSVQHCQFIKHNYNAVLGWIRPKFENVPPPVVAPLEGLSKTIGYAPTWDGQDITKDGVHYKAHSVNGVLEWQIVVSPPIVVTPPETPPVTSTGTIPVVVKPQEPTVTTSTQTPPVIISHTPPQIPQKPVKLSLFKRFLQWLFSTPKN